MNRDLIERVRQSGPDGARLAAELDEQWQQDGAPYSTAIDYIDTHRIPISHQILEAFRSYAEEAPGQYGEELQLLEDADLED